MNLVEEVKIWLAECKRRQAVQAPLFVGINGTQGIGKTTLTSALVSRYEAEGRRVASISIDDFYLTRAEQQRLADANPDVRCWQKRGYPGTHDIGLGQRVLEKLKTDGKGPVKIPRYDKSAFGGLGDRAAESLWARVELPLDIVLFEGWMLGFVPPEKSDETWSRIDQALLSYGAWTDQLDAFLVLEPCDHRWVVDWRVEAEEKMKAQGSSGMSLEDVRAYAELFLPAYERYLPTLEGWARLGPNFKRILIGKDRKPMADSRL